MQVGFGVLGPVVAFGLAGDATELTASMVSSRVAGTAGAGAQSAPRVRAW